MARSLRCTADNCDCDNWPAKHCKDSRGTMTCPVVKPTYSSWLALFIIPPLCGSSSSPTGIMSRHSASPYMQWLCFLVRAELCTYIWFHVSKCSYTHTHTHCYGQNKMACHLHSICIWDAVTTCIPCSHRFLSAWDAVMLEKKEDVNHVS